ncbi:hypothetical protein [Elizabethkingia anophelis]|uniref:hypothetical protein n=1 Tax=Elizabethkingia anophelis TaxID=1117645 RepID=UPI003892405E|nr:hypothetical protein [Elizabethkingia anophelis]
MGPIPMPPPPMYGNSKTGLHPLGIKPLPPITASDIKRGIGNTLEAAKKVVIIGTLAKVGDVLNTAKEGFDAIASAWNNVMNSTENKDSSTYKDITGSKNAKNNKETNVTRGDFEKNLEESGYEKTQVNDDITRYSKGEKSYTTRDESKQGSPTADFRKNPDGKGPVEIKIRLKK